MRNPFDGHGAHANSPTRREFLGLGLRAAALVSMGALPAQGDEPSWRARGNPFTLGVASGDPTEDGFVLWTRLILDPLADSGVPQKPLEVRWEVALDDAFRKIAARGDVVALPELAHAVHVEVEGLPPGRDYFYRFTAGGERSPIGRSRTAPAPGHQPAQLHFGVASCQSYQSGYFTALRHMADENLDAVLHLGDYIYESGHWGREPVRPQGSEVVTLAEYRSRYALYKSDPDLQAAHARHPFIVTWDDHEVENNYAGALPWDDTPLEAFLARRAAAYQAFYEHLPLRRTSMPRGPDLRLYRALRYGTLADLYVLDTRQYRSDQPCGDGVVPRCDGAHDPKATLLGADQKRWLLDDLARTQARWTLLLNQVPFAQLDNDPGPDGRYDCDKWDGYLTERKALLESFRGHPARPVIVTGDMHANVAVDLKHNFEDPSSATVGVEFIGTSISTAGDGGDMPGFGEKLLRANPHVRFFNGQRGYLRCTLTAEAFMTDFRVLEYVRRPGSPISTRATFVVETGRPGLQRA